MSVSSHSISHVCILHESYMYVCILHESQNVYQLLSIACYVELCNHPLSSPDLYCVVRRMLN